MTPVTKTTQAIILHQHGSAEVLRWQEVPLSDPAKGEVQITHHAIGINFVEIYGRKGIYPLAFPSGLGTEAAGVITAVGEGVAGWQVGERVAYATGPLGSYAFSRNIPASVLVRLPDAISCEHAAGSLLKGMTAHYLLRQTHDLKAGETLLLYAAGGGVGLIVAQWARYLGARVIGIVGSAHKKALATSAGCQEVIVGYEAIVEQVREITHGRGVDVVYDSVGKDTFHYSLDCLRPRGLMVSYGNASGEVEPISPGLLAKKGALFLTRPTLAHYANTPQALQAMSQELFARMIEGTILPLHSRTLPFSAVAQAHRDLESRNTLGTTVLVPERDHENTF